MSSSQWPILIDELTRREAETFGLVLLSAGIGHRSAKAGSGWEIRVPEHAVATAQTLIQSYLYENREGRPERPPARPGEQGRTFAAFWGVLVVLAVYAAVNSGHDAQTFVRVYGASARQILNGEWYRCATALLLHADAVHLVGNMAGIAVFGTAVCSVMGWGVGWAMMVVSGMLGNLINAWFYEFGHLSIGASTAVFGAVGLLSSYQFVHKIRLRGERLQAFLPLMAGVALLAFLGAARNSDVMGHLFGFASGLGWGMAYCFVPGRPFGRPIQLGALLLMIAALAGAWCYPIFDKGP